MNNNRKRRCENKAQIIRSVKIANRVQADITPVEIELSEDFKKIVVPSKNPAINRAKRHGVSYTVTRGTDIIEVKGRNSYIVGKVAKSDVVLSKGKVYILTK